MNARRAARALVERSTERFESRHGLDESRARLEAQLARARPGAHVVFTPKWTADGDRAVLDAEFAPAAATQRVLRLVSLSLALLVAASAWAIFSSQESAVLRFLLPIATLLAMLGMPLAVAGLGSQREAAEARIRKAIRAALVDEEPAQVAGGPGHGTPMTP